MKKLMGVMFLLAGLTVPAQALDLPLFGKKADEAAAKKETADTPAGQDNATAATGAEAGKDKKAEAPFPVRVTNDEISGKNTKFLETYFVAQSFQQKIQLPDGSMTPELGRVLVFQKGETYVIGFYRPVDGAYVLIGQPVPLQGVEVPREDFHQTQNVPMVVARRTDGQGVWRVFVQSGKTVSEQGQDDATAKPAASKK